VMVGLRRREGVQLAQLLVGLDQAELERRWQPYLKRGLLHREGSRWRLSDPEGLALSNAVLREWLAWWSEQVEAPPPSP